jgi:hypothetical protein
MRRFFTPLLVAALVTACSDRGIMEPVGDTASQPLFSHDAQPREIDMRTAGTWAPLVDGAWVQAGGASGQGTGAGVFPSFLLWGTTQANNGKGYNTDASGPNRQYEISGGSNTRSVPLNSIPTIARNDVIYREFRFDGQAPGAQAKEEYSVDEIRVYLVPNVSPNNAISNFLVAGEA